MGDAFPAPDPVARFNAGLGIILNDLVLVARETIEPDIADWAFLYYFRTASAHLWEGVIFIRAARKRYPEIAAFVDALEEGEKWRELDALLTPSATDPLPAAMERARNLVWHYPTMLDRSRVQHDDLFRALEVLRDEEVGVQQGASLRDLRSGFADSIAAVLTYGPELGSLDEGAQRAAIEAFAARARDGVITLQTLCRASLAKYLEERPSGVIRPA